MVHQYVRYNGHRLTIRVNFMVNVCVGVGGFESNGFVTKIQSFSIDGHYMTNVISGVGHPVSELIVPLVLRTVCCEIAGAPELNYRSLRITSILLRRGNISGRPYC
jgi:hypothetical protein